MTLFLGDPLGPVKRISSDNYNPLVSMSLLPVVVSITCSFPWT